MTFTFTSVQSRSDSSLPSRWVVVVALQLFLAASAAADSMALSAATECDPNVSQARTATLSSPSTCAPNERCYWNGKSSLGGYCINDDQMSFDMNMPEALQEICSVCEIPEYKDEHIPSETRVVTAPHELVGRFHCGELDGLGQEGKIPRESCDIFRHMIYANDLCGCMSVVTKDYNGPLFAADTVESEAEPSNDGGKPEAKQSIDDGESQADDPLYDAASRSSSEAIAITFCGGAVSIVTMLMAFH